MVQFISAPILLSHIYLMDEASAQRRALRTFYVARKSKGYRTMLTIANQHDLLTRQKPNRTATGIGLGLVRLLLDAGRTDEARTTLASLQYGFQTIEVQAEKPSQKHGKVNRLKGISRRVAILPLSMKPESVQSPN